jgi:hypothetical protein
MSCSNRRKDADGRAGLGAATFAALLLLASAVQAQPNAEQLLTEMGFSAQEKQRVLNGEFVTAKIGAVSDRDLSFAVAFLVKTSPEELSKQVIDGQLIADDAQVKQHGMLGAPGSLRDLSGLTITDEEARALVRAGPGDGMNRSTEEQASFKALRGQSTQAVLEQLQRMLLARYQSYRASGLNGIATYDRGTGGGGDVAADLTKAVHAATAVQKYMPALYTLLLDYPQSTDPAIQQSFVWLKSVIRDKPTYVLAHILAAGDAEARAVVRREFYVSTGYNAEQSIAGFLPVTGGTVVLCMSHAFTDQVAGSGGSMKRSIGSRVMADEMKEIFERGRKRLAAKP